MRPVWWGVDSTRMAPPTTAQGALRLSPGGKVGRNAVPLAADCGMQARPHSPLGANRPWASSGAFAVRDDEQVKIAGVIGRRSILRTCDRRRCHTYWRCVLCVCFALGREKVADFWESSVAGVFGSCTGEGFSCRVERREGAGSLVCSGSRSDL